MTVTTTYSINNVIGNTRINAVTGGNQDNASVTTLGTGGAIAVSYLDPTLGVVIEGRNGIGLGSSGPYISPGAVASSPGQLGGSTTLVSGNIVQTWTDYSGAIPVVKFTVLNAGLTGYAAGFTSAGVIAPGQTASGGADTPAVAMLPGGGFVITYSSNYAGLNDRDLNFAQYNSAGGLVTSGTLDSSSAQDSFISSVTGLAFGGYVVVYEQVDAAGHFSVYYTIRENDGSVRVGPTVLRDIAGVNTFNPQVTALANGDWSVSLSSRASATFDRDIYFQVRTSSGAFVGSSNLTASDTDDQNESDITSLGDNLSLVTYTDPFNGNLTDTDIKAALVDGSGNVVATATLQGAGGVQRNSSVVALQNGAFAVTYTNENASVNPDGSGYSVNGAVWRAVRTSTGDNTNEVLSGSGLNDDLVGNGGNDQMFGGNGTNTFSGGGGTDIAGYFVASTAVTIIGNAGTRNIIGSGFSDTLTGVEWAVFTDRVVALRETARSDFNGNGTSDVVLQNGGTIVQWSLSNGAYLSGNAISTTATGFNVVGKGDFNADGTADLLLAGGGNIVRWSLQNGVYSGGGIIASGLGSYNVVGTGDFDRDGDSDVVLQSGGTVVRWVMQNGNYSSGAVITSNTGGFTVVGTGDFDKDADADIVLSNGAGTFVSWKMENGNYVSGAILAQGATGFNVVGTGDFDGDGDSDILLQNGNTVVEWFMQNGAYSSGVVLSANTGGYAVVATGDYNGDGTCDVLLQSGGTVVEWNILNGAYTSGGIIASGATGFNVR
jgi:FG-GAP-like repeat